MKKNIIITNYLYNMLYQLMNIIIPVITIPYISRVLGVEAMGINGYTSSIVLIFTAMATFGMNNYGSKSIAYVRESKEKKSREFCNIWSVQVLFSSISIMIYFLLCIIKDSFNMRMLFIMQLPNIIAALLDISWFYIGIENIKKISIRNILVKITALIFIFLFIRKESDLWLYILINSLASLGGNIIFWVQIFKFINWEKVSWKEMRKHIVGAFTLLLPQLIGQVYTTLDRTIIGHLSNLVEVGYYDQSQKIARISLTVVTSLSIVLMPRIANMYSKNDIKNINIFLKKSINFTTVISVFIASFISSISKDFVPIFFGSNYEIIIPYMILTSLIVIFISIGGVFANQFALPTGKNKEYIIPLISGAIINIISNNILVPELGALGGVISIVITELCIFILRVILIKKYINVKFLFEGTEIYFIAGMVSFTVTYFVQYKLARGLISIIVEGVICFIIYLLFLIIFNNPLKSEVIKLINDRRVDLIN